MANDQVTGRTRAIRAAAAALVAMAVLAPVAVAAQEAPSFGGAATSAPDAATGTGAGAWTASELVPVYDGGSDGTTSFVAPVGPVSGERALPKLSDIQVTYVGFGPSSRAAFEYAVSIWERMIRSNVPIKVQANWKALSGGQLGSAASNGMLRDFSGAPRAGTYYSMALADARAGRDLRPGQFDVVANFNSAATWNVGPNEITQVGEMDLVTVALHEIGHGLGITSSFRVSGGVGTYGYGENRPSAWDRFLADGNGASLLTGNGTATLAAKLQSNAVRFTGGQAVGVKGGTVRVYSPSPHNPGSSLSHLDESAFSRGTPDSLMTPFLASGEAVHDPGDVALGALRDLGWQTTASRYGKPNAPAFTRISAGTGRVDLTWAKPTSPDRGLVFRYVVSQYTAGSTTPSRTFDVDGNRTSLSVSGLSTGTSYRFRIKAENLAGIGPDSALSPEARPLKLGPFANVDAFLQRQYLDILYRGPSAASLASRRSALNTGADTPGETVVALTGDATHTKAVPPTIRLYLAYFKRLPDPSGLAYWAGKVRGGTSLHKASDQFAASSEFKRTYGSLSNGAFVDLVYQNVLGRAPDSSGRSYWVGKLNKGFARGSMMITVSESGENVRKTADRVAVVGLFHVLLRRIPTASELEAALGRISGGTSVATLADELLLSKEYHGRITGKAPLPVQLEPGVQVGGIEATQLATGDMNKDGRDDLVAIAGTTTTTTADAVAVMLGTGTGLSAPVVKAGGFGYWDVLSLDLADVDGDSHLDVVVATRQGIRYFPGSASGALGTVVPVASSDDPDAVRTVAAGDVTGDGRADIVGVGWESATLTVWRQLPTGGFAAPATKPYAHQFVPRVEIVDVNGDGRNDVVALADRYAWQDEPESRDAYVAVFLQAADGTLANRSSYGLGPTETLGGMTIGDFTGDGKPDVAVGLSTGPEDRIRVLKNSGTGTFTTGAARATLPYVEDIASADMDGDGRRDIIALWSGPRLGVHLQTSPGVLASELVTSLPDGASHAEMQTVVPLDIDGDGKLDLATIRGYVDATIWTYLQR